MARRARSDIRFGNNRMIGIIDALDSYAAMYEEAGNKQEWVQANRNDVRGLFRELGSSQAARDAMGHRSHRICLLDLATA